MTIEELQHNLEISNAEKMALDQMYMTAMRENLQHKKDIILLNNKVNSLIQQLQDIQSRPLPDETIEELLYERQKKTHEERS